MTTAWQESTELALLVGSFAGGLVGAPDKIRSSQRSKVRAVEFHYTQSASAGGNIGDNIEIADLYPTDRLCDYMFTISSSTASQTLALCGWDLNINGFTTLKVKAGGATPTYTYDSAFATSTAGVFRPSANFTGPIVVGSATDPAGDESTANVPPYYGSGVIQIFLKVAGAGLAESAVIAGYLLVDVGN